MDLVLNHTSDEHPWFIEARKSKDNPYHDYYVWRDGVEGEYPNELMSAFCGLPGSGCRNARQYYLHQFSVKTAGSELGESKTPPGNLQNDQLVDGERCWRFPSGCDRPDRKRTG